MYIELRFHFHIFKNIKHVYRIYYIVEHHNMRMLQTELAHARTHHRRVHHAWSSLDLRSGRWSTGLGHLGQPVPATG